MSILLYALSICIILSSNTLYVHLGRMYLYFNIITITISSFILLYSLTKTRIKRRQCIVTLAWILVVASSFIITAIVGDGFYSTTNITTMMLLSIFPLLLCTLYEINKVRKLTCIVVNIIFIIACLSLALWFLGPMLNILKTNCSIVNYWTSKSKIVNGYYYLLFITQYSTIHLPFGDWVVARNSAFFVEAPIFSYVLCVGILFECMYYEHRKYVVRILSFAVITTLSVTGIVFLVTWFILNHLFQLSNEDEEPNVPFRFIGFLVIIPIMLYVIYSVILEKTGDLSGMIRFDDFRAGFKAWIQSPLFGYGFSHWDVYKYYISAFRIFNQGFSNSIMTVLIRGGMILLLPYIVSLAGFFTTKVRYYMVIGILHAIIWITTIVWDMPLSLLLTAFGVFFIISRIKKPLQ